MAELAYLAGVFDGEGCIFACHHRNYVQTGVSVNGTYYPMIRSFFDTFKLGSLNVTTDRQKYKNAGTRDLWRWAATNRTDQMYVLTLLSPWLIEKAEQARCLLRFLQGDPIDVVSELKQLKRFNFAASEYEIIHAKTLPHYKLNEARTIEIYKRVHAGEKGKDLAQEYGVSRSTISKIKRGDSTYVRNL